MRKSFAVVSLLLAAANVHTAEPTCPKVRKLVADAAFYRDEGLTEEQLRWPLPPRNYFASDPSNPKAAELRLMHEIVDELYRSPSVPSKVYTSFKVEQCRLRTAADGVARDFAAASEKLAACAILAASEHNACAVKAAAVEAPGNGP